MIQDYLIMFCGILFSYSLIPQIIKIYKTKSANDLSWNFLILTLIGMLILTVCFLTMKYYFSFVVDLITSTCYIILIYLKFKYRKYNKSILKEYGFCFKKDK